MNLNVVLYNILLDLFVGSSQLTFDGSESKVINLSNYMYAVQGNGARTISFNIQTMQNGWAAIFATGSSSNACSFNVVMGYGGYNGIIGIMGYNNDFYPNTGTIVNDGNWHAVQVTFDGSSTLNIFVDGRLDNTAQRTYRTAENNNFIGKSNHLGFEFKFNGNLQFVKYYSGIASLETLAPTSSPSTSPTTLSPSTISPTLIPTTISPTFTLTSTSPTQSPISSTPVFG